MSKASGGKPPSSHSIGKKLKACAKYRVSGKHEQHKVMGMIRNLRTNPCDRRCSDYLAQYLEKVGPSILGRDLILKAQKVISTATTLRTESLVERERRKTRCEQRQFEKNNAGYQVTDEVTQ